MGDRRGMLEQRLSTEFQGSYRELWGHCRGAGQQGIRVIQEGLRGPV